jgi:enterochelin esterase-like enzyme
VTRAQPDAPAREPFSTGSSVLAAEVHGELWSAAGLDVDVQAPLLVVHDGPAYDHEADLTTYLQNHVEPGTLPELRAALLQAPPRDRWYSANPAYATAMAEDVMPYLTRRWPTSCSVGVGASLGALAWLHAQASYPQVVDGLLLQSGSFFRPETDPQESSFSEFPAIVRFVASVHRGNRPTRPVPTVATCGADEENLANNRRMVRVLRRLGYPVRFAVVPGGHDYASWRAVFDPHLPDLVRAAGAHANGSTDHLLSRHRRSYV